MARYRELNMNIDIDNFPSLKKLKMAVISTWPEHATFLDKSIVGRSADVLEISETLSANILLLADDFEGGIEKLSNDYRFMCEEIVLPEELFFRRNGKYRLSRFEDANAECYANAPLMERYMNGLLLSDVLWSNHAHAFANFVTNYLPRLPAATNHLEIGPGHGLFLYFAAQAQNVASVTGWDVSPTSIELTGHALAKLGARLKPSLVLRDLFDQSAAEPTEPIGSVAMSEILEHLEDPVGALRSAAAVLNPGGLIFVNVPANSPAPDHIFLFESVEHAAQIVKEAGLEVLDTSEYPMSGATLDKAKRHKLAISCVVIGRKPFS
jgi:2-polyprenyl-3-methyl-5-hydroxy-6-metoxy-1,4-benzoquinol methylase